MIPVIALSLVLAAPTPPVHSTALQLVFLPDDAAAPAAVVRVDNVGGKRSLAFALVPASGDAVGGGGALTSQGAPASALLLPRAPDGASLAEHEGGVIVTVDDAGAWQEPLLGLRRAPGQGPGVVDDKALRVVVTGFQPGAPALLLGSRVRIAGRAVITRDPPPLQAVVVAGGATFVASPTAVTTADGCMPALPVLLSAPDQQLRLATVRAGVCAAQLALVPVKGMRTDPRRDVEVAGVVVVSLP